jgi:hypothetical protein
MSSWLSAEGRILVLIVAPTQLQLDEITLDEVERITI